MRKLLLAIGLMDANTVASKAKRDFFRGAKLDGSEQHPQSVKTFKTATPDNVDMHYWMRAGFGSVPHRTADYSLR